MSSPQDSQPAPVRPAGFFQRLKGLFGGASKKMAAAAVQPPSQPATTAPAAAPAAPRKKKPQRILLMLVLFALGAALLVFFKRRKRGSDAATDDEGNAVPEGVKQIRYWKRHGDWENPLTLTLIETSDGMQMLDEADPSGNGVVTVYLPKSQKGGKRCFSLVRQKAIIYHRQNYEPLKTDCVDSYRLVKRDFKEQVPITLTLHSLPRDGFEGVVDYLKQSQVVPG